MTTFNDKNRFGDKKYTCSCTQQQHLSKLWIHVRPVIKPETLGIAAWCVNHNAAVASDNAQLSRAIYLFKVLHGNINKQPNLLASLYIVVNIPTCNEC